MSTWPIPLPMLKYLKILLLLLAFLAVPLECLQAQERIEAFPGLEWYKAMAGANYYDQFKDMEQGPDGSIYYAGTYTTNLYIGVVGHADTLFQDTITHDPLRAHAYVVKLDSNGVFQWAWIIRGGAEAVSEVTDITLDGNGGIWIAAKYQGDVEIPDEGAFYAPGTHGFITHLDADGVGTRFTHITAPGVVPLRLFLDPQGQIQLMVRTISSPIVVGDDTLQIDTASNPFLAIVRFDTAGNFLTFDHFATLGSSRAGHEQSTMDQWGNIYLLLWTYGNSITIPGDVVIGADTITLHGNNLIKINQSLQIEWTKRTRHIANNYNISLEAKKGEIYLAADSYDSATTFIEQYDHTGELIWELSSAGYWITTGDITLAGDFLYWSGYYQCDMSIDTIHFKIGEQQPWPWTARTGYLAVVNRHTGKVAWVMSDATTNQDKRFGKIVANGDDNITVETRVVTTLCTIDTLTLQVWSMEVPYHMLLRFDGKQFPQWPESPDSVPEFLLWPNPTSGTFTLQVDASWGPQTQIEIYNMAGQRLLVQDFQGLSMVFDLNHISSQILLIRLVDLDNDHNQIQRLVIQR
jgi:hypothetical protein